MGCTQQVVQARTRFLDPHGPPLGTELAVQGSMQYGIVICSYFELLLYAT